MKPKKYSSGCVWFAALTLTCSVPSIQAASLYWDGATTSANADGGAGTWNTTVGNTNWDDAATAGVDVPWTNGSDAVFGGTAGVVTVAGTDVSATGLTFNTTGYSVTSGTFTLTGTPVIATGANNATISSVIAGTGFTKTGTGVLTLSNTAANTFTGTTTINGGVVSIGTGSAGATPTSNVAALGTSSVAINTGGTLRLWIQTSTTSSSYANSMTINGGTLHSEDGVNTVAGAVSVGASGANLTSKWTNKNLVLSGVVSGTGAVTTSTVNEGGAAVVLSNANTYSGGTTVNSGNLILGGVAATDYGGAGRIIGNLTANSGATVQFVGSNVAGYNAGGKINAITLNGATLTHSGSFDNGWGIAYTLTGATMQSTVAGGRFSFGNTTTVTTNASASSSVISGQINMREANTNNTIPFTIADGAAVNDLVVNANIVASAGGVGITKNGPGTMVLAGASAHSGATIVNAGTLALSAPGTMTASAITVNNGGIFRTEANGKTLLSLTANNGSTLGLLPGSGSNTTTVTGTLNLADGATVNISPALGNIAPGTYDLLTAGSITGTGTPVLALGGLYGSTRATGSVAVVGNKLQLTLTGAGGSLVWNNASASGATTGTWDNTLLNFDNGGSNDFFRSFDAVTISDTVAGAKTINLSGTLAPSLLTVNSTGNVTFASTGALVGAGGLVKSGASTLTIGTTTGYTMTGALTVNAGTIDFSGKSITPSVVTLVGGALNNGTIRATSLDLQSGSATALFTGATTWTKTTAGTVTLSAANTITGAGSITAGMLSLGNTATLGSGTVSVASGTTLAVSRNANSLGIANTFSGTGAITLTGTNNGTATNASEVNLTGNSSAFSGQVTITGLRAGATGSATNLGTGPIIVNGAGAQAYLGGYVYPNAFTISGNGWFESVGVLGAIRYSGTTTTGTITLAGNARLASYLGTGFINGPIVETGGSRNLEFGTAGITSTFTLNGASTYTGTTTLTASTVILNGSLGATAVTVGAASTIGGTGSIGSGGSLTFTGASNLSTNTAAALTVNGNVTLGTTTTVALLPAAGQPSGVITVLNYTGTLTGDTSNLALANAGSYRQVPVFAILPNKITVDIGAKSLFWKGTTDGVWTTAGANLRWNTTGTGETDAFYAGDKVTFDDTGVATTITLTGVIQPSSITVNSNTNNYTFTETAANYIAGGGSLTKSGNSTLTLTGAPNTFTGGTTLNGGTIIANGGNSATGSLGAGNVTVNGGTITTTGDNAIFGTLAASPKILQINTGGTVTTTAATGHLQDVILNGGTLSATTANTLYTNWNLDYGVRTLGNGSVSTISGGNISLTQTGGTKFNIGAGDRVDVSSVIANVSGASDLGLIKQGSGTLNLASANTYTSATTVSAGTLLVTNSSGSATGTNTVTVAFGATLAGYGRINGALSSAGTIAPGEGTTGLLFLGATTLTGTYACEVNGFDSDQLVVGGDLNITGATLAFSTLPGGANQPTYILASYSGNLTGTFNSTNVPAGYVVNYNTFAKQIELVVSGYNSWLAAYPGLSDTTPGGDPDNDGIKNLMEYVLGGNPGVSSPGILPTQELSGANVLFKYKRDDRSKNDTTQTVQWSADLGVNDPWHDITIPAASAGAVNIAPNDADPDDVTVTIPKAPGGKMFVRLKVDRP